MHRVRVAYGDRPTRDAYPKPSMRVLRHEYSAPKKPLKVIVTYVALEAGVFPHYASCPTKQLGGPLREWAPSPLQNCAREVL